MIRTLIFGAIAGYVGKKLYDEGKLTEFKNDLVARYSDAKAEIADSKVAEDVKSTLSNSPILNAAGTPARPLTN